MSWKKFEGPVGMMPIRLLLVAALTIAAWSLWVRRKSFHCRHEGPATLIVAAGGLAAFLTSEPGSRTVGAALHRLTGMWHCDDFIGHMLTIICASATVYMVLIRLGDKETVREFYATWVLWPLSIVVPILQATFAMSNVRNQYKLNLENLEPNGWLAAYWTLLAATIVYLLVLAMRIVHILRGTDPRFRTVLNLWMLTFSVTIMFVLAFEFHVVTPFDIRTIVWTLGYTCLALWSFTPAYSWMRRSRALVIPDVMPAPHFQLRDDD